MKQARIKSQRTTAQRKRDALVRAGIAPSRFGRRQSVQPHRDRKREAARGERKHGKDWQ